MSNPIDDGGPAVPFYDGQGGVPGMTLRDYFAAKAMQGEMANRRESYLTAGAGEKIAQQSYLMADAMLKARNQ